QTGTMEVALRSAVEESLAAYAHSNAVFMAERLVACHPSPESSHLLATAYHAAGETHRAYSVLNPATTPRNRYLLAVCAFKLGKLQDAENALMAGGFGDAPGGIGDGAPNPAYCSLLLGQICRAANRTERAVEHFQRALRICPTLWVAWQNLC
ncbi:anaphase-promoting complex, cyclosome, subunit 3-domain-containing protein, partial [Baffinella frigidus]